jgi:hypothetical protein
VQIKPFTVFWVAYRGPIISYKNRVALFLIFKEKFGFFIFFIKSTFANDEKVAADKMGDKIGPIKQVVFCSEVIVFC